MGFVIFGVFFGLMFGLGLFFLVIFPALRERRKQHQEINDRQREASSEEQ